MFEHHDREYWLHSIQKEDCFIVSSLAEIQEKDRKEIAEKIIVSLRHFVQDIQCYIREVNNPRVFDKRYDEQTQSNKYCRTQDKYQFLCEFLDCLNSSIGHQLILGEYAERLVQKYFYFLVKVKLLLLNEL